MRYYVFSRKRICIDCVVPGGLGMYPYHSFYFEQQYNIEHVLPSLYPVATRKVLVHTGEGLKRLFYPLGAYEAFFV